ncbi:MAG TPA: uridine kinase [Candidatus Monoglobus merdigallinarum]|uniref:Uridine kinase n=1 Tax=Candidatus Monoglobus merdigallinarum TaxID=2838698 RepID=A0A9D1PRI3_9FIRM|nr:uridine kinase [Candidatus Monoglobus merdigallinarum]
MSFEKFLEEKISALLTEKQRIFIAIDGRCASGKTTLAASMQRKLDAAVIHMDDFFLRPEQRTKERLAEPGGNFDRERLSKELLNPLLSGGKPVYRPYSCRTQAFEAERPLPEKRIYIIEGSYSCYPDFADMYDLRIFVTTEYQTQLKRIAQRNKGVLNDFAEKWIPYEEQYFKAFGIMESCDLIYRT